jgi:hypothetical protein
MYTPIHVIVDLDRMSRYTDHECGRCKGLPQAFIASAFGLSRDATSIA